MTKRITIEQVIVVRALRDVAPKVVAAGLGGLTASQVISLLALAHIAIPVSIATLLVALIAAVCGYIKADTTVLPELERADAALRSDPVAATVDPIVDAILTPPTVTNG